MGRRLSGSSCTVSFSCGWGSTATRGPLLLLWLLLQPTTRHLLEHALFVRAAGNLAPVRRRLRLRRSSCSRRCRGFTADDALVVAVAILAATTTTAAVATAAAFRKHAPGNAAALHPGVNFRLGWLRLGWLLVKTAATAAVFLVAVVLAVRVAVWIDRGQHGRVRGATGRRLVLLLLFLWDVVLLLFLLVVLLFLVAVRLRRRRRVDYYYFVRELAIGAGATALLSHTKKEFASGRDLIAVGAVCVFVLLLLVVVTLWCLSTGTHPGRLHHHRTTSTRSRHRCWWSLHHHRHHWLHLRMRLLVMRKATRRAVATALAGAKKGADFLWLRLLHSLCAAAAGRQGRHGDSWV